MTMCINNNYRLFISTHIIQKGSNAIATNSSVNYIVEIFSDISPKFKLYYH